MIYLKVVIKGASLKKTLRKFSRKNSYWHPILSKTIFKRILYPSIYPIFLTWDLSTSNQKALFNQSRSRARKGLSDTARTHFATDLARVPLTPSCFPRRFVSATAVSPIRQRAISGAENPAITPRPDEEQKIAWKRTRRGRVKAI